jgi:SAM-dependent methyltransferase
MLLHPICGDRVLDVATGAGNMALTVAPEVASVVALDLTPEMLALTRSRAQERGLRNLAVARGAAERLPFASQSFSVVTVRIAAHHFADIATAVREMTRVLKPGGRLLVVDTAVPEDSELDSAINLIEVIRDPSHVRNYKPSEWRSFLEATGLRVEFERMHSHALGKPMRFSEWTARMKVSPSDVERLRVLFQGASTALREVMNILPQEDDFLFTLPEITILARFAA